MDKDSGAYFWYNTRDETTQWAVTDATGEVYYGETYAADYADADAAPDNQDAPPKLSSQTSFTMPGMSRQSSLSKLRAPSAVFTIAEEKTINETDEQKVDSPDRLTEDSATGSMTRAPFSDSKRVEPAQLREAKGEEKAAEENQSIEGNPLK